MPTRSPKRPTTVPSDAWWDPADKEWVRGSRDEDGRLHGLIEYWRPDGTLLSAAEYAHGILHGSCQRFHESGEVSSEGPFVDGLRHGLHCYFQASGATTEAFPFGAPIARVEVDFDKGNVLTTRILDASGHRYTDAGEPFPSKRPDGIPEDAEYRLLEGTNDYRWVSGVAKANGDGSTDRLGHWRWWAPDGVLRNEDQYQDGKLHGFSRSFDERGTLLAETHWKRGKRCAAPAAAAVAAISYCDEYLRWAAWVESSDDEAKERGELDVGEHVPAWPEQAEPGDAVDSGILDLCEQIAQVYLPSQIQLQLEDSLTADGEMHVWHRNLLELGYPIGQSYSGDGIIQIATGPRKGAIYFSNHEVFEDVSVLGSRKEGDAEAIEGLEEEFESIMDELGLESLANLEPDALLDLLTHDEVDSMYCLARNLSEFWAILGRVRA